MGPLRVIGGTLLVAGTAIGAGMLAIPVSTAYAGFLPALVLFVVVWVFMAYTAFLFLETNMAMEGKPNLVTMARKTLGPVGEVIAWVCYLLLLYSLTAAYLSGSGALLNEALGDVLPSWFGPLPFAVIFGIAVYMGIRSVDLLNRVFMIGLGVTYLVLVFIISPEIKGDFLLRGDAAYALVPTALVVTSFGFHIIIPSLVVYLKRDVKRIKLCLLVGSTLPLVIYCLWELLIVGAVPLKGEHSLTSMLESGQPGATLMYTLKSLTESSMVATAAGLFSFCAIVTSFLGVTLSLSDFLRDGLRVEASVVGRVIVVILTFVPPLFYAWLYPRGFIVALSYGGIFVAILLGLLPIAMVFSERYIKKMKEPYRVGGGMVPLFVGTAFFIAVIFLEIFDTSLMVWLKSGS